MAEIQTTANRVVESPGYCLSEAMQADVHKRITNARCVVQMTVEYLVSNHPNIDAPVGALALVTEELLRLTEDLDAVSLARVAE